MSNALPKSADAFRTISEVATDLDLPQHVLRFWETRFPQIRPLKRAGGRRFYRPADVELLTAIRQLLYGQGYTIKGVQRLLKDQGTRAIQDGLKPSEPNVIPMNDPDNDPASGLDEPVAFDSDVAADAGPAMRPVPQQRVALETALALVLECEAILQAVRGVDG